jgi:alpha-L-rhamnosidase
LVKPLVGGGLTHAAATLRTPYGNLSTEWRISTERTFTLAVAIPPNTRATVSIPTRGDGRVLEDGNPVKGMLTEKADELGNRYLILELGSGEHTFTAPWE